MSVALRVARSFSRRTRSFLAIAVVVREGTAKTQLWSCGSSLVDAPCLDGRASEDVVRRSRGRFRITSCCLPHSDIAGDTSIGHDSPPRRCSCRWSPYVSARRAIPITINRTDTCELVPDTSPRAMAAGLQVAYRSSIWAAPRSRHATVCGVPGPRGPAPECLTVCDLVSFFTPGGSRGHPHLAHRWTHRWTTRERRGWRHRIRYPR